MATWSVVADIDSLLYNQLPDANYGSAANFNATVIIVGGAKEIWQRGIMNFDLSGFLLVAGVDDITSAKLIIDIIDLQSPGEKVDFRRLDEHADEWIEAEVTWNEYSSGNPWDTLGGHSTPVDKVTMTIPASSGIFEVAGFETLAVDAFALRNNLLALIMRQQDEAEAGSSRSVRVRSSEATIGTKPTLEITYTPPDVGRRSVPRSSFGETVRPARPATPGRAFAGARTAQASRPQRRRPR